MFARLKKYWRSVAVAVLAFATVAQVSCWKKKPQRNRPIDFVPSGSEFIAVVDYEKFVTNDFFRKVFDISELERALATVGLAPKRVASIAGFARLDLSALTGRTHDGPRADRSAFGVVVQGRTGFRPIFKSLSESGWVHQEYHGRSLWTSPDKQFAAASVEDDILAVGMPESVREVVDVATGRTPGAMKRASGNEASAILRRIGIRSEINIAMSFSQEMRMAAKEVSNSAGIFGGMTGANLFARLFDVLGAGRGFGLSFAAAKGGISSRVIFVARDAGSAKIIAGLVSVAKIVIPRIGDFGQMEEAAEMVRGLHVASEDNLVLLSFKIPETILSVRLP
jgi:hypothetical protein